MEELETCGVGFRAKYIADTVDRIYRSLKKEYNKDYDIDWIKSQNDNDCHEALQVFNGIGPKVADCIMLFSMKKYKAYPVDVWVKRVTEYFFLGKDVKIKEIQQFAVEKFGDMAGFAQEYLFYYARELKINPDKMT
jgi:N-glycosylase/DNA lyase